jgi:glycosyltransferase EpsH
MSGPEPILSFIVPIYNVEKYLEKCVRSILNQSLRDIEVILVNDGSTDSSFDICNRLSGTDERLRVFTHQNCGLGATRNVGLKAARGKYISCVDPDDWIDATLGEKLVSAMESTTADFASFRIAYVTEANLTTHVLPSFTQKELRAEDILNNALIDNQIYTSSCNKVYRHSFLLETGMRFPDLRAYEDVYFTRVMSARASSCIFVDEVLYFALTRIGSISRAITIESFDAAVRVIDMERTSLKIESRVPKQQDIFEAHVVKFFCFLIFMAAFRLGTRSVFFQCVNVAKQVGYTSKCKEKRILRHLSKKNRLMAKIAGMPNTLWFLARILRHTRFSPY